MPTNRDLAYPWLVPSDHLDAQGERPEYEVRESAPAQSYCVVGKTLAIPKALTRQDKLVQLHEMMHHRESIPTFGDSLEGKFRKLLEEPKIEASALRQGLDIRNARDHLDWSAWPVPQTTLERALMWIQLAFSWHVSTNQHLRAYFQNLNVQLGTIDQTTLMNALREIAAEPTTETRDRWAAILAKHFQPPPPEPEMPSQLTPEAQQARAQAEQDEREQAEAQRGAQAKAQEQIRQQGRETPKTPSQNNGAIKSEKDEPGLTDDVINDAHRGVFGNRAYSFTIHRHVTSARPGRLIRSTWNATDDGATIKYEHRITLDQQVFGRKARGGTLLIDVSGSMHWDWQVLGRAIAEMPNLTVAVHCGDETTHVTGHMGGSRVAGQFGGILCVLAEKGRMVRDPRADLEACPYSGGNGGSDLPALRWVVKHAPAPWVWLSDGQAWTVNASFGQNTYLRAIDAHMRRFRIVRLGSIADAIDFLNYKPVIGSTTHAYDHKARGIQRRQG